MVVQTRWYAHTSCIKGVGLFIKGNDLRVCSSGYD